MVRISRTLAGLLWLLCCASAANADTQGLYLNQTTLEGGEAGSAYLSTDVATTDLIILDEVSGTEVYRASVIASEQATASEAWLGAGWSRSEALPSLPPGIYSVSVDPNAIAPAMQVVALDRRTYETPLFVRPAIAGSLGDALIIYDVPTMQSYNAWGGKSYYSDPRTSDVSRNRPGFKRRYLDAVLLMAEILSDRGFSWEVADTGYVEDHPGLLDQYRVVILAEQMEYVTRTYRDQLEAYFDGGGRVVAISNELMIFQTRRTADVRTCYKYLRFGPDPILEDGDPSNDHLATYEFARLGLPATQFFGVSTWLGYQPLVDTGWTVHRGNHWIWEGTGLADGDSFGDIGAYQILDGTLLTFDGSGDPYPDATQPTETPDDFMALASVPTVNAKPFWCWVDTGLTRDDCVAPGWGVIGVRQNAMGGAIAVIPDKRWLTSVVVGSQPAARRMTENLVDAFASPDPLDVYGGYPAPEPGRGLTLAAGVGLLGLLRRRHLRESRGQ